MQGDVDYRGVQLVASSDEFAGSRMQEWAYMAWADRQLRRASEMYLIDRDASLERLTAIVAFYEQFAESSTDSDIRNRARLGLARVAEMRGQLDEAKKQYALVQGALAAVAEARLDELQGGGVEDSTKWLATAELPKPPAPSGAGAPGRRPDFGVDLPSSGEAAGPLGEVQSMEEILGGLLGGSSDDGARYDAAGAGESAADSEPDADAPATDDEAAAAEAADAEDAATPAEQ
ncbi:MAG TPA: hypothetical protein PJ982_05375 [Lacipirellulaceae bacterium]|nr:hypothetical protein [Lacipirellulaceae bacterium]